ncbi:hypothetical protein PLESTF_001388100 [Pleodorina starrii]|nr:hypothetical protein PLESTF_001388100 [Pleodorina starrii]
MLYSCVINQGTHTDTYHSLTDKTRHFFVAAFRDYPAVEWIVKMDDDVYMLPERLLQAADQWAAAGADYIGCMVGGPTFAQPGHRWHEPNALQFGRHYPLRALGPTYVLSRRVVQQVLVRRFRQLRPSGSCEDSALGAWMLGSNAVFMPDMRLCAVVCDESAVAMCDPAAQGLELDFWRPVHDDPACTTEPPWPMPYVPAFPRPHERWRAPLQEGIL